MNAILNEARLQWCGVNDETIICTSRLRHNISKSHKQKKNMVSLLKETNLLDQSLVN